MKRNKCVDTLKGMASILVVFIHYPFPGIMGIIVKAIARAAVPFFFTVSGFYFGLNSSNQVFEIGRKNIFKTVNLLIIGFAFSEVFFIQQHSFQGVIENQLSMTALLKLLIFNETGDIYHLWYLCALIYCYMIFMFLKKYLDRDKHLNKCLMFFLLLLLGRSVLEIICRKTNAIPVFIFRNWLFTAIPFFGIGFLGKYIVKHLKEDKYIVIVCILIGTVISIVESFLFGKMEIYIGTLFLSSGLFLFAIRHPDLEVCRFINVLGNRYSIWIYIFHWGIMNVEYKLISEFGLDGLFGGVYLYISPIVLTLYTIFCAITFDKILIWIEKRKRIGI